MKKLLVTGGAGFIGANFVHYWLREYPSDSVVVLDSLTYAGNLVSLDSLSDNSGFNFVHGDICNQSLVEKLLRDYQIDTLVHFAAESHVDRSISGPDVFIDTNIIGTHSLLKAARQVWIDEGTVPEHRFHHVSTDEVYGTLGPTIRRLAKQPSMHLTRHTLPARRLLIIWCAPINTLLACRSVPAIVLTTTVRITFPKS